MNEKRTMLAGDTHTIGTPPLRFIELHSVVVELGAAVATLKESLGLEEGPTDRDVEETERRLMGQAQSIQEQKLVRLTTTVMECVHGICKSTEAVNQLHQRIGS